MRAPPGGARGGGLRASRRRRCRRRGRSGPARPAGAMPLPAAARATPPPRALGSPSPRPATHLHGAALLVYELLRVRELQPQCVQVNAGRLQEERLHVAAQQLEQALQL
jgi:hypothetical protein